MPPKSFEDMDIWQKAHEFVLQIYKLSENFPKHELFCLISQLRRAAISIPANFAEGFRKDGKRDKVRYYNIALGSLEECRYYLRLAVDLGYGDTSTHRLKLEEISKMLTRYSAAIKSDISVER